MGKGCFIRFIIILTIFIAVILYIFETKFDDWILKPGKGLMMQEFNDSWDKELAFVKPSAQKDSLRKLIEKYISDFKSDEILNNNMESIKNNVKDVVSDSTVDWQEIEQLRKLFKSRE